MNCKLNVFNFLVCFWKMLVLASSGEHNCQGCILNCFSKFILEEMLQYLSYLHCKYIVKWNHFYSVIVGHVRDWMQDSIHRWNEKIKFKYLRIFLQRLQGEGGREKAGEESNCTFPLWRGILEASKAYKRAKEAVPQGNPEYSIRD